MPQVIRPNGEAELVGNVMLWCTGGVPTAAGAPVPTINVTMILDNPVRSRILNSAAGITESLMLIDYPEPADRRVCGSDQPIGCPILGVSGGIQYAAPSDPGYNDGQNVRNVYPGRVAQGSSSTLEWPAIPFDPPGDEGVRRLLITNVRVKSPGLSGGMMPSMVTALMQIGGSLEIELLNPTPFVAFALPVIESSLQSPDDPTVPLAGPVTLSACTAHNGELASNPGATVAPQGKSLFVQLRENFNGAAIRTRGGHWPNPDSPTAGPVNQAALDEIHMTESGLADPNLPASPDGLNWAGSATTGTRVMLRADNVPAGVKLYTQTSLQLVDQFGEEDGFRRIQLRAEADGGGEAIPVNATTALDGGLREFDVVTMPNGTRSLVALFEANKATPWAIGSFNFPIYAAFPAGVYGGSIGLEAILAPLESSGEFPRFRDVEIPVAAIKIERCPGPVDVTIAAQRALPGGATEPIMRGFVVTGGPECNIKPGLTQTPATLTWGPGAVCTVEFMQTVEQTAGGGTRYEMSRWADGVTGNPRAFPAPAAPATYTAVFTAKHEVKLQASPAEAGTVTVTDCADCGTSWYPDGSQFAVRATANAGWVFKGWSKGPYLSTSGETAVVLADGPKTVVAEFEKVK